MEGWELENNKEELSEDFSPTIVGLDLILRSGGPCLEQGKEGEQMEYLPQYCL